MELRHGGFVVDVPEGWQDQSALLLVAPPPSATPMKIDEPTETLAIRFVAVGANDTAISLLEGEQARLEAALESKVIVVDDAPFTCALGVGWHRTHKVSIAGVPLRQLCVAIVVGDVAVLATATAGETRFAKARPLLERALAGMRRAT